MSEAPTKSKIEFVSENNDVIFLDPDDLLTEDEAGIELSSTQLVEHVDETEEIKLQKEDKLNSLVKEAESVSEYVVKKKEETRGILALIYLRATFLIFILGFVVSVVDSLINKTSIIENLQKLLPLISGIFLGSLGFVIGYYFRKDEEESK
jgi:superfamily I DNA and/or RNA helicase